MPSEKLFAEMAAPLRMRSRDGTSIAFDRSGEGPPVILVDGAFCSRSFGPMPKLAPLLARHFTVFAYDRRARGDSGDTAPYAVEREIEDLDALIRQAGGWAFVYAISSGAVLALHAAASGLSVKKLALYEPPFMVGTPAHLPPVDHQAQLVRLVAEGRRGEAVKFYMKDIIGMPGWLVTVFRILPMWSKLKAVAPSLPYDSAILGDFSLPTRRAASLTMPTLVISGDKSMPVLREAAQRLAAVIPGAQLRTLVGQTHNVSAGAMAPVLKEFFAP